MKRLVLAGALAVVAAGQTLASDLPPPSPVPPPRAPAAYMPPINFGFNLGYGFGSSKWSDPTNFSDQGTTGDFNLNGFLVGPTIGANFQVDSRPRGLRTRNSWSSRNRVLSAAMLASARARSALAVDPGSVKIGFSPDDRFGNAVDRILFYGTAGGTLVDISAGVSSASGSPFQRSTKAGWTVSAGIEAALSGKSDRADRISLHEAAERYLQ
jgi:outer membrane immunogenic protein